jgi:hypothetical protein
MGWNSIKPRPADTAWSKYVRTEARKCEIGVRCTPQERHKEDGSLDISYMDCVHIKGRRKESTRFDRKNTLAGCKSCHKMFHDEGNKFVEEWYIGKFGQKAWDLLTIQANTPIIGKDDASVILFCKSAMKNNRPEKS